MRRVVFIALMVVVAVVVAFFCWREFAIPNINFVADVALSEQGLEHKVKVQRLYAAEVDFDAYNTALEEITNLTEYTEEEKLAAAIASGRPEFFPQFHLTVHRVGDEVRLVGFVDTELAEGQKHEQFMFGGISLEAVTGGDFDIAKVEIAPLAGSGEETLTKILAGQQMAIDITNASAFEIILSGADGEALFDNMNPFGTSFNGTVTLQFIYSIDADIFIPKRVLEEQVLQVHAIISLNEFGGLDVEYILEDFSNLEEMNGGQ